MDKLTLRWCLWFACLLSLSFCCSAATAQCPKGFGPDIGDIPFDPLTAIAAMMAFGMWNFPGMSSIGQMFGIPAFVGDTAFQAASGLGLGADAFGLAAGAAEGTAAALAGIAEAGPIIAFGVGEAIGESLGSDSDSPSPASSTTGDGTSSSGSSTNSSDSSGDSSIPGIPTLPLPEPPTRQDINVLNMINEIQPKDPETDL